MTGMRRDADEVASAAGMRMMVDGAVSDDKDAEVFVGEKAVSDEVVEVAVEAGAAGTGMTAIVLNP